MRVTPIIASAYIADGGAMFGLVPKPIWSRLLQPNERNGIPQNANCLLLELDDGRRGLVDTGCGPAGKFSEKARAISALGPGWPLQDALASRGLRLGDIDFVVFSHLHWDHGGGASLDASTLSFPGAVHFVHAREWASATSGDPLLYRSYPPDAVEPLRALDDTKLQFVEEDDSEILPGIRLVRSGGHTEGHCTVVVENDALVIDHPDAAAFDGVQRLVYAADVCPMQHNLRLVFQTAYDTYPLETRAWKRRNLPEIAESGAMLMFTHDPDAAGATIKPDDRGEFAVANVLPTL